MPSDNLPPPDRSVYVQPKRGRNPLSAIIIFMVISALFFLARNWSALNSNYRASSQNADNPKIAELHAGVTTLMDGDDTVLTVTNNDTFTWNHVIVEANEMTDGHEHRGHADLLKPGDSMVVKASQLNIHGGIADVKVYTLNPNRTITGTWEGTLSSK